MDDVEATVLDYVAQKANVERATLSRETPIESLDLAGSGKAHQALVTNGLRNSVVLRVGGGIM